MAKAKGLRERSAFGGEIVLARGRDWRPIINRLALSRADLRDSRAVGLIPKHPPLCDDDGGVTGGSTQAGGAGVVVAPGGAKWAGGRLRSARDVVVCISLRIGGSSSSSSGETADVEARQGVGSAMRRERGRVLTA